MGSPAPASSSKAQGASSKGSKARWIDSRRLLELTGLLTSVAGLLILLSLASYLPEDPSLNTAVATGTVPHNWIGPAGAYVADVPVSSLRLGRLFAPIGSTGCGCARAYGKAV